MITHSPNENPRTRLIRLFKETQCDLEVLIDLVEDTVVDVLDVLRKLGPGPTISWLLVNGVTPKTIEARILDTDLEEPRGS